MDTLAVQARDLIALAQESDVTDGELVDLARRLATANAAMACLKSIAEALTMELAARVESETTTVEGFGLIERGYSRRSAWAQSDSADLLRHDLGEAVVAKVALDLATGELDPVKRNIARAAVSELWEVLPAFSSLKRGAHRLGIHIDEYRTFSDVPVVRVRLEGDLP